MQPTVLVRRQVFLLAIVAIRAFSEVGSFLTDRGTLSLDFSQVEEEGLEELRLV